MDLTFYYPNESISVFETNETSTVGDMYRYVTNDQHYASDTFVLICDDECLWDMNISLSEIILHTCDVRVEALCNDPQCLMSIRHNYQNEVSCYMRYTSENHPICMEYFSANPINYEDIKDCVTVAMIPNAFLTQELCKDALNHKPDILQFIPERFLTQKMCEDALASVPHIFEYIPKHFLTQEMCEDALFSRLNVFRDIPERFLTQKMCESALARRPYHLTVHSRTLPHPEDV